MSDSELPEVQPPAHLAGLTGMDLVLSLIHI